MSDERRLAKARHLASNGRIVELGENTWHVFSLSRRNFSYTVDAKKRTCTCPDFEDWGMDCKHILAVRLYQSLRHQAQPHESNDIMRPPAYRQNWSAYNAAQVAEKEEFHFLLDELCAGITEPPTKRGRPTLALADVVHAAVTKVYTMQSGRRASTDVRDCRAKGFIDDAPHYNSISHYLTMPKLTPVLMKLVEESASPLAVVESQFAVDATGFGTGVYDRWYTHEKGEERRKRWLKAHCIVGTKTNVITAVEVTEGWVNDTTKMAALLAKCSKRFDMREVSADMGYQSEANILNIEGHGAKPFIPFKTNAKSSDTRTKAWKRLWHYFWFNRDDFLSHYHRRSNVECTFSMIKRKFGGSLRSKKFTSQVNEVLCKILCHNIVVLIHETHELGIEPEFWQPSEVRRVLH